MIHFLFEKLVHHISTRLRLARKDAEYIFGRAGVPYYAIHLSEDAAGVSNGVTWSVCV